MPGNAAAGMLLRRIHLPIDDDDHMPPRSKPQLSSAEMEALAWWIGHGASDAVVLAAMPARLRSALAHGDASVAAPSTSPAAEPTARASRAPPTDLVRLYGDVVAPILVRRCGECHLGDGATSGLHVDDPASLIARGAVVPGKPDDSPLYKRLRLPASDDDHMPRAPSMHRPRRYSTSCRRSSRASCSVCVSAGEGTTVSEGSGHDQAQGEIAKKTPCLSRPIPYATTASGEPTGFELAGRFRAQTHSLRPGSGGPA